jgi:hypothetical protein
VPCSLASNVTKTRPRGRSAVVPRSTDLSPRAHADASQSQQLLDRPSEHGLSQMRVLAFTARYGTFPPRTRDLFTWIVQRRTPLPTYEHGADNRHALCYKRFVSFSSSDPTESEGSKRLIQMLLASKYFVNRPKSRISELSLSVLSCHNTIDVRNKTPRTVYMGLTSSVSGQNLRFPFPPCSFSA